MPIIVNCVWVSSRINNQTHLNLESTVSIHPGTTFPYLILLESQILTKFFP